MNWADLNAVGSNSTGEETGVTDVTPSGDTVTITSAQQVLASTTRPLVFETPIPLTPVMATTVSVSPPSESPHSEPPEPV